MDNKVKKNFYFNIILVIFNASFPLLTAPYVSRVLGTNNLGIINYMMSVTALCVVIASVGVPVYGIRTVAKYRHDTELLNEHTTSILIINVIFSLVTLLIFLMMFTVINDNIPFSYWIIYIMSFSLSFLTFEWFFVGVEDFKYITIRSVLIKVLTLLLIFTFVKDSQDFLIYGVLLMGSQITTYILNFLKSLRYWRPSISFENLVYTFKATKYFYFTLLLASSFTIFDRVLVGLFLDNSNMALYFRNKQITMLGVGITTSLVKVLTPRLSVLIHKNRIEEYKSLVLDSFEIYFMFSFPLMLGVATMSTELVYFFGGHEYLGGSKSLIILSIWMFLAGINVFIDNQISIPNHTERITTYSSFFISITTISLSVLITPLYGILGASIALVIGELIGFLVQYILTRRKELFDYKILTSDNLKTFLASFAMVFNVLLIKKVLDGNFYIRFFLIVTSSVLVYSLVLVVLNSKHFKRIILESKRYNQ